MSTVLKLERVKMERAPIRAGSTVTLEKPDGRQLPGVKANFHSGQPNQILILDVSFPLEKGDLIKRKTPSGIEELFEVLDPGFYDDPGLEQHYRAKVKPVQPKGTLVQSGEIDSRKVFVVHGRNKLARRALFEFLRSIGLQPLEWSQALNASGKGAPFIGEVLDSAYSQVRAVVVLLTGDDLAMLDPTFQEPDDPESEKQLTPQARPNVLFEAGMAFGRHQDETILVQLGTLKWFSDVAGRHVVRINNAVASRQDLANRLKAAGCSVDLSGTDWHSTGDFDSAVPSKKPAPPSPAWPSPSDLHDKELAILKYLRQHEDTAENGGLSVQEIANALSLPLSSSKHHLAELEEKELVRVSRALGRDPEYFIARSGRSLLIKMEGAGRA